MSLLLVPVIQYPRKTCWNGREKQKNFDAQVNWRGFHNNPNGMTIYVHPRYRRSYKNLESQLQRLADGRIALFRHDAFDSRLDTHRLHGKLKKQWSFSVSQRYRILFEFLDKKKDEVVFLDIGSHDIYQ